MVKDTSKVALKGLSSSGRLSKQQFAVLDHMRWGFPHTRKEIARRANLEINVVCGRVNELLNAKLVEVIGKVKCSVTGNEVEGVTITALGHTHREAYNKSKMQTAKELAVLLC